MYYVKLSKLVTILIKHRLLHKYLSCILLKMSYKNMNFNQLDQPPLAANALIFFSSF